MVSYSDSMTVQHKIIVTTLLTLGCGMAQASWSGPSVYLGLQAGYNKLALNTEAMHAAAKTIVATREELVRQARVLLLRQEQAKLSSEAVNAQTAEQIAYLDNLVTISLYGTPYAKLGTYSKRKQIAVTPVLGLKFNDYLALEAGYSRIRKFTGTLVYNSKKYITSAVVLQNGGLGNPAPNIRASELNVLSQPISFMHRHEYALHAKQAYYLDALATLPLHQKIALVSSVGIGHYKMQLTETSFAKTVAGEHPEATKPVYFADSKRKLVLRLGLGVAYKITDALAVRAMARYQKLNLKMDFAGKRNVDIVKNGTSCGISINYML